MPYPFELPELGYADDALEPHIDARTMNIHRTKHHATYTKKLNSALESQPDLQGREAEALVGDIGSVPENIRTAIRNNGGGYVNHNLFWQVMQPGGSGSPTGSVGGAIESVFGSTDAFMGTFTDAATNRFGSGWAWLVVDPGGNVQVISTANQDSPLMDGLKPVLGLDVWEHAYYLNYQNRRPDYIKAWWNVVNWDEVNRRYEEARG